MQPSKQRLTRELLINDFAYRCFRDTADQDYIAARLAYHHDLPAPSLWQSQQAIEKYLKCILLLHRVPATTVSHDLTKALELTRQIPGTQLSLTTATRKFIGHLSAFGNDRYLTKSTRWFGIDVVNLDRSVWELRRFCTLNPLPRQLSLKHGKAAPRYSVDDGYLEHILRMPNTASKEARKALIRWNAFCGSKQRVVVKYPNAFGFSNAPLWNHPELLPLIQQYVHVPKELVTFYKTHKTPGHFVPEEGLEI